MEGEIQDGCLPKKRISITLYKINVYTEHNLNILTMTSIISFITILVVGNLCIKYNFL